MKTQLTASKSTRYLKSCHCRCIQAADFGWDSTKYANEGVNLKSLQLAFKTAEKQGGGCIHIPSFHK